MQHRILGIPYINISKSQSILSNEEKINKNLTLYIICVVCTGITLPTYYVVNCWVVNLVYNNRHVTDSSKHSIMLPKSHPIILIVHTRAYLHVNQIITFMLTCAYVTT